MECHTWSCLYYVLITIVIMLGALSLSYMLGYLWFVYDTDKYHTYDLYQEQDYLLGKLEYKG